MGIAEFWRRWRRADGPGGGRGAAGGGGGGRAAMAAPSPVWTAADVTFTNELIRRLGPLYRGFTGGEYARQHGGGFVYRPRGAAVQQYILHHTAGPLSASGSDIWRYHVRVRGWDTDGYHVLVSPNGATELLIPPSMLSYGAAAFNPSTVHVCVHGNYTKDVPTPEALQSIYSVFLALDKAYGGKPWRGHSEIMRTACPGALLPHLVRMRGASYGDAPTPPARYP